MADKGFKRKLAAILSADAESYSRLLDDDEEASARTPTTYLESHTPFCRSTDNIMLQRSNIDGTITRGDCLSLFNPGAKL